MKHLLTISTIALLSVWFTSCTPPLYKPSMTNVPVLTKKGDMQINYGTGSNGHDIQGAYAVTDEIGVMMNTSFANHTNDSSSNFNKHAYLELGVGYNILLNKATAEEEKTKYIYAAYTGGGFGGSSGSYSYGIFNSYYTNVVDGKYFKFFIQNQIGLSHKNVDLFLGVRYSLVNFYGLKLNLDADYYNEVNPNGKNHNHYLEPTFNLRFGGPNVKFISQTGLSAGYFGSNETTFRNRPLIFIIGFQVSLNTIKE